MVIYDNHDEMYMICICTKPMYTSPNFGLKIRGVYIRYKGENAIKIVTIYK